jgi:antitoxin (DNA-binding transcriptional repressor) of toxin-antitoxin stability system
MATNLSATQLARNLSDILNRVRYADEAFVIMRNGEAVATLAPMTQDDEPTSEDSPLAPTEAAARQEAAHEPESVTKEASSEDQTTEDSDRLMDKLMDKLMEARSALGRGDSRSAERTLDDFMTEVEAERGNSLTDHQADVIVDRIQNLARKMRRASRAPLPTASAPDSTDDS